jgi:hypothetical protein
MEQPTATPEPNPDRHLDGNAAGGLLGEVFRVEVTTMVAICGGCGMTGPVAELMRYGHDMGAILRCPACDTAVVRVARTRDRLWLDLRGATAVHTGASAAPAVAP